MIPITFLAIFNLYVTEKLQIAYICKQPPQFDENLTREAIMLMKYAPLFMLGFGYWALGNRSYFFNEPAEINLSVNRVPHSNHTLDFNFGANPSTFAFILFSMLFIIRCFEE